MTQAPGSPGSVLRRALRAVGRRIPDPAGRILRDAVHRVAAAARRWRARLGRRASRAAYAFYIAVAPRFSRVVHRGDGGVPLVMCLWKRPHRLREILAMLDRQSGVQIHLILWNNDRAETAGYVRTLETSSFTGAVRRVDFHSSPVNIGGAARLLVARSLRRRGYSGPIVMLDDDQEVDDGFVSRLVGQWRPGSLLGVWAWQIFDDYWDRAEAPDGAPASYVGTGGSVCDVALVGSDHTVRAIPRSELFLEDIWLSAEAHRAGYAVSGIEAAYRFTDPGTDQWHALAARKSMFYDQLGRPGLIRRP